VAAKEMNRETKVRQIVGDQGFDPVGFAAAESIPEARRDYEEWLKRGYHGGMSYLERHVETKFDPARLLTGARSIIMVALNYFQNDESRNGGEPESTPDQRRPGDKSVAAQSGRVSLYAWGKDYHKVIGRRLKTAVAELSAAFPEEGFRTFVDTSPIAERQYAERSGIGFIGRNTLLITRRYGSWVFLGGILTTLDLTPSQPAADVSGMRCPSGCTRCIDTCPTDALHEPHKIDASKCISYLTIERRGASPTPADRASEDKSGKWVFGCDVCQQVCPFNLKAEVTEEHDFRNWIAGPSLDYTELENAIASREAFVDRFAGSPVMRAGIAGMSRSVQVVLQNDQRSKSS